MIMSYYIAPRFLDKLSIHITKNFLDLPGVKVPLILGIHGRKGEGKSFQCELVYQRMGVEVVHMSAGELESPDAGDPARLVRLRYREAGELARVHGRMTVLMINDLDMGAGRVDDYTQYTVNTQLVNATLMNIADHPTNVQLPGSYDMEPTQRIPIIVTGNDFSTLYAPLIRDGRMEKFYWEPDRTDRIGIVNGIFEMDAIARPDIETLVGTFPNQAIDFFAALRSRLYDEQVRKLIHEVGLEKISKQVMNSADAAIEFHQPDFSLSHLIEFGNEMVKEQDRIGEMRLSQEYISTQPRERTSVVNSLPSYPDAKLELPIKLEGTQWAAVLKRETGRSRSHAYEDPSHQNGQSSKLSQDILNELQRLVSQGHRIGIEYVDERRFRTNSWQNYATVQGSDREAIATLESCLNDHSNDYIRIVGIDPKERRRVLELVVQRPKQQLDR